MSIIGWLFFTLFFLIIAIAVVVPQWTAEEDE